MNKLHPLPASVKDLPNPEQFNFPHEYIPHPLALAAAEQVQTYLRTQTDFKHNFGFDSDRTGAVYGKMFGVLVVQDKDGNRGFLAAFSGKLAGSNHHDYFIPPVFDILDEDGFYRRGERAITKINDRIAYLETRPELAEAQQKLVDVLAENAHTLTEYKAASKRSKTARKKQRAEAKGKLDDSAYAQLEEELSGQSIEIHLGLRDLKRELAAREAEARALLGNEADELEQLRVQRKLDSNALQQKIFEHYSFLNEAGERKNLKELFADKFMQTPPAGSGECAAPKLLQYAFKHDLRPITMAEFWWGAPPTSIIRKHGDYYPACRGKCEPILGHMLSATDVEANPLLENPAANTPLGIAYEDEYLVVIDKPAGLLSVPGIHIRDSVQLRMKKRYPEATGPLVVHRLDRMTSGLILVAKSNEVHKELQAQFMQRSIKKRYVAELDGHPKDDFGLIVLPLRINYEDRPRQLVDYKEGKYARTEFEIIARGPRSTRVYFYPHTGRTHQLRMHAAHADGIGVPIVGDVLYGNRADRLHLHAETLTFLHPETKEPITVTSTAPF